MLRMQNRPMYLGQSSADKGNKKGKAGSYGKRPNAVSTGSSSSGNSKILQKYINSYSNQGMIRVNDNSSSSNNNNNNPKKL